MDPEATFPHGSAEGDTITAAAWAPEPPAATTAQPPVVAPARINPPPPPGPPHANSSPYIDPPTPAVAPPQNSVDKMKTWLFSAGRTVFHGMEFVGEVVASVLGIDESKYQDIYDSMTEEELAEAQRVHETRNAEYETWLASQPPGDRGELELHAHEQGPEDSASPPADHTATEV